MRQITSLCCRRGSLLISPDCSGAGCTDVHSVGQSSAGRVKTSKEVRVKGKRLGSKFLAVESELLMREAESSPAPVCSLAPLAVFGGWCIRTALAACVHLALPDKL